jgi:hypothetical protein
LTAAVLVLAVGLVAITITVTTMLRIQLWCVPPTSILVVIVVSTAAAMMTAVMVVLGMLRLSGWSATAVLRLWQAQKLAAKTK